MLFGAIARRHLLPVFVLLAVLLGGCATQTRVLLQAPPEGLPRATELASTVFFPQERYQCGPATLAMALRAAGVAATPEALVSQVYVPAREGSLPVEMLAAGRRNGTVSVVIPPRLDALLEEVAAGTPVVILQNLGLSWFPLWHYALVIGYDLDRKEIVLRSGLTKRLVMSMRTFELTWARSGYWAMVALPPGQLPRTTDETATVTALVAFEKDGNPAQARQAYEAALRKWPANLTLLMGRGNTAYAMGDRAAAAEAFRDAARQHPDAASAYNNLAVVLNELGQVRAAREAAEKALALGGTWREAALETLKTIDAGQHKDSPAK